MWWIRKCGPWFAKMFLFLVMVCNTGVVGALKENMATENKKKEMSYQEMLEKRTPIVERAKFLLAVASERVAKGEAYSPYDYFRDLTEIRKMEVDLEIGMSAIPELQRLIQFSHDSIKKGLYGDRDIAAAQKMFPDPRLPGQKERKEFVEMMKEVGWRGVSSWLLTVYARNLLPAFLLYLLWIFCQWTRTSRPIPNPLSLVWVTLAHPYYLIIILVKWIKKVDERGREYLLESEYRRTKERLFSYLSPEEAERIRQFAKDKLSLASWREHLKSEGLKPSHTLAAALVATLIIAALPKLAEAKAKTLPVADQTAISWHDDSNHLPRMAIVSNDDERDSGNGSFAEKYFCEETFRLPFILEPSTLIPERDDFSLQEFLRRIEHVPLQAVWSSI